MLGDTIIKFLGHCNICNAKVYIQSREGAKCIGKVKYSCDGICKHDKGYSDKTKLQN